MVVGKNNFQGAILEIDIYIYFFTLRILIDVNFKANILNKRLH